MITRDENDVITIRIEAPQSEDMLAIEIARQIERSVSGVKLHPAGLCSARRDFKLKLAEAQMSAVVDGASALVVRVYALPMP